MNPAAAKSRGWLVTLGATGLLVAYVLCAFLPGQKNIIRLRSELREKRQFVSTTNLQIPALDPLEKQLARSKEQIEQWRKTSPQDPNLVELMGRIATLADQTGVRLHRLSPQDTIKMAVLRQHPLTLELEGGYGQLVGFVGHIEGLPETFWLQQLRMKPSAQNGQSMQCELMLTVFADNPENSG